MKFKDMLEKEQAAKAKQAEQAEQVEQQEDQMDEGVSSEAKAFMKQFNGASKLLKEDAKTSDTNGDWYGRLEYIKTLISKELKKR